uniref:hypothetical protein n=1 Tax=Agathobacter sp. TaxID=2021311 RepID=UPI004056CF59
MCKMEELINSVKLNELLKRKDEEKKIPTAVVVLAVIGVIVLIAAIAYGVYRFLAPDYLEDFEDELEDEFDEDFFEEDDFFEEEAAEEAEDVFAEE